MKTVGFGGASTLTGLNFESKVDFQELLLKIPGYSIARVPDKVGMGIADIPGSVRFLNKKDCSGWYSLELNCSDNINLIGQYLSALKQLLITG
jgi:hypothetical protein